MYEEAMGVTVNSVSFDTGTAMSAAMASGDVHMAVSQGVPPFEVATSAEQDLQMLDVAVPYADNDNCVARTNLEIDAANAAELAGSKVAVPLGTAARYSFLRQMDRFGVDLASLEIFDMTPPDGAAAIAQGSVDLFCGWGGSLRRALEYGNVLLTGAEKQELGILVFDVTSAPAQFVAENPDLVDRWLARLLGAQDWVRAHQFDARRIFVNDTGLPEALLVQGYSERLIDQVDISLSPERPALVRHKCEHLLAHEFLACGFDLGKMIDSGPLQRSRQLQLA